MHTNRASNNTIMHMGIENPTNKRKLVLTSAVDCVQALQNYEKYLILKKEQLKLKNKFSRLVKDVNKEFKEFYELIPEVHFHEKKEELPQVPKKEKSMKKVAKKPEKIKVPKPPKHKLNPEMDQLEKDMESLKNKLNSL